jgi:hypothetical protein
MAMRYFSRAILRCARCAAIPPRCFTFFEPAQYIYSSPPDATAPILAATPAALFSLAAADIFFHLIIFFRYFFLSTPILIRFRHFRQLDAASFFFAAFADISMPLLAADCRH